MKKMSYEINKEDIYNMSDGLLTIKSEELNEYFNIVENKEILIKNGADFDNRDQNSSNINKDIDKFNIMPKETIPDNVEAKLNDKGPISDEKLTKEIQLIPKPESSTSSCKSFVKEDLCKKNDQSRDKNKTQFECNTCGKGFKS